MSMPSISSLVSSRGRLFTVEDLGSAEHPALPGKFALVARETPGLLVLPTHRLFSNLGPDVTVERLSEALPDFSWRAFSCFRYRS